MKTRALGFLVFAMTTSALPGCFDDQTCPYGEVMVHDGNYGSGGVCVRRSYYAGSSAGSASSGVDSGASPPTTTGAPATSDGTGTGSEPTPVASPSPAPAGGACGGPAAQGDSVRVVDKSELAPAFADASPNLADGAYALVQATFFRNGQSASPVRSLKASLDVRGPTLTVNAQDTSVAGLPGESLTFLIASPGVMTKTCESVHGSVSAWFFPFVVGATTQPQMSYDGASGFLRVVVSRADGATELVFAR
jgi:hypothetical protein